VCNNRSEYFVNPLQFGPGEDLDKYPRQLARDVQLAAESGAQLVFAPTVSSFYNAEHQTMIMNEQVASLYCGAYRPGHFAGVLTVVAKLFLAVEPTVAFFGKKDFQQAFLIQKMVSDLNWNISIELVPTVREKSGLARSSRNEF
jgi:pantoate--beta-alanine ligase